MYMENFGATKLYEKLVWDETENQFWNITKKE
jgi:hypothetical protein